MPRRKARPHPSTLRDREDNEEEHYEGHPEHGEVHPEFNGQSDDYDDEDTDDDEEDEADDSDDRDEDDDKPLTRLEAKALQRELDAMKQTNAALLRQAPPREPEEEEDDEPDWENLIFSNPKEAVRLMKDQAKKEVSRELRGEYQKDQGEKEFWRDFYKANPDLKEDDRDIIEMVLNKNLAKLGDMPVQKAITELGDLTRKRIMRYSNGKGRRKSRAQAEGATPPSGRKAPEEKKRPVTLSMVIKARQENRRKAQTVA